MINQAPLTVSGITANSKVYNQTLAASLNTGFYVLNGKYPNDLLNLVRTAAVGTFASKDVANNITVFVSGLTLSGARGQTTTR